MMNGTYSGGIGFGGMGLWMGANWFFMLIVAILVVLPFWKIFSRAGFSGWLSLLMLVPMINLIVLYVVAFAPWSPDRGNRSR